MGVEHINVPGLSEAIAARGVPLTVVTKANGFAFISGLPPIDPETGKMIKGDIVTQLRQAMSNLGLALKHAGSSFENTVMLTIYLSNSGFFSVINEAYRDYFPGFPPARTCVTVGSWPFEADLEVEAIAAVDG
jgi:2-iminobutanoate/2-iminopropanoate deaminase